MAHADGSDAAHHDDLAAVDAHLAARRCQTQRACHGVVDLETGAGAGTDPDEPTRGEPGDGDLVDRVGVDACWNTDGQGDVEGAAQHLHLDHRQ
ncbi:MAG: hypothetical protein K1X95_15285 [Acidimicrobiia bacterium]|nr:hypothetical protein [Acidimicrobiia bacterium]